MTVAEFMAWSGDGTGRPWQLVDGELRPMAPVWTNHGAILARMTSLIDRHLADRGDTCRVVVMPGIVPRVLSQSNLRVPDLAVSGSRHRENASSLYEPLLVVHILSPSNEAETWSNVWTYTTIPSLREILILRSVEIGGEILRRNADDTWPERFEHLAPDGQVELDSIQAHFALAVFYATTELRPEVREE